MARALTLRSGKDRELTQDEIMDAFRGTMAQAPIFDTDAQSFHIAAPKPLRGKGQVSTTVDNQLATAPTLVTGADASVKVSPFMTIGTGDARMMLNIYTSGDGTLKSSLAVFDGVELTVDGAGQASETINASAFKGWMDSNVYQSIADGFSQLSEIVTQDMIDDMPQQTREQVRRALRVDPDDRLTPKLFRQRQRQLEIFSRQSQARKRAMARMATSTDHMAGMKRAHHRPGETTATNTPFAYEEIAEKLNQLAKEEGHKIRQEGQDAQAEPAIQGPTSNLSEAVESIGELMPGGVRKVDGETLLTFLARDKDASPEQREIAQDLLSKPTGGKRGTFYFGETDALADIEEATIGVAGPTISLGRSYPTPGLAFIANTSPETVLHEMLHIQTTKALEAYVAEDGTAPRHVQEAGRNIERLMQQMRDTPPTDESAEAWGDALAAMDGAPDRLGQMGEFVSWMLSNQRFIERGQQRKAQTACFQKLELKFLRVGTTGSYPPRPE